MYRLCVSLLRIRMECIALEMEARIGSMTAGDFFSRCSVMDTRSCCWWLWIGYDLSGLSLVSLDLCWPYLSEEPARYRPWVSPLVHGMVAYLDWAGLLVHGMVAYLGTAHKLCVRLWVKSLYMERGTSEGKQSWARALWAPSFCLDVFWPVDLMWVFLEVLLDSQRSCTWSGKVSSGLMDVVWFCSCLTALDRNSSSNSGSTCTVAFFIHRVLSILLPTLGIGLWFSNWMSFCFVFFSFSLLLGMRCRIMHLMSRIFFSCPAFYMSCSLYVALSLMNSLSELCFSWPWCVIKFCLPSWMYCWTSVVNYRCVELSCKSVVVPLSYSTVESIAVMRMTPTLCS